MVPDNWLARPYMFDGEEPTKMLLKGEVELLLAGNTGAVLVLRSAGACAMTA